MISAEVIKSVEELLHERGIKEREGELLGDTVARGLNISPKQAEEFLQAVHDGQTIEEAKRTAGLEEAAATHGLFADIARAIGSALARLS